MKKLAILCICLLFGIHLWAQSQFPNNAAEFYPALKKFMSEGATKEDKEFMDGFEIMWNDGPFQPLQKPVMNFCDEMLKKKYRPELHFKAYLKAIRAFYDSQKNKATFDAWEEGLQFVLKKKSGNMLVSYLEQSMLLFTSSILFKSAAHTWSSESADYKFALKNNQIEISFPATSLRCIGKGDSTLIENTTGTFYPLEETWSGVNGKMYWDRLKLKKEEVNASLPGYALNLKRSSFIVDSVLFINTKYFSTPLMGRLEEKLTAIGEDMDSRYPKFDSYTRRFLVKEIEKNVDYEGGFSFYGNRFIAKGDSIGLAYFYFKRNGEVFLKTASKTYVIADDRVSSAEASVVMYLEEDSIFHPGLEFKFLRDKREVNLIRLGDGPVKTPFFNTYHKIDMFFEALYWKIDEPIINIAMTKGSAESIAKFRSAHHYSEMDYERWAGLDEVHPLTKLTSFLRKSNNQKLTFKAIEYAQHLKADITVTRQMLMRFSIAGLLSYNTQKEEATVSERFFHYINARNKTTDYDVLEFNSLIREKNASLSLLDYRLDMDGVGEILLSDSQNVRIYPYDQKVSLKKGRDFTFSGMIEAGKFGIYGKNFTFFYKDFKIDLPDVDSVKLVVNSFTKNEAGFNELKFVKTVIEDLNAELFIDHPNNKSGLKPFPTYPTLLSKKESFTYYQRPSIEKGVYKRDDVYFKLDPFKLDSLDNFKTEQLSLAGTFTSGIFPDIRENLKVMPDYSLGFLRKVGSEGIKAYEGKGTFYDTLTLTHNGIRGAGRLKYLTSSAWSRDFVFYPDSMNALAYKFGVDKTKGAFETPDVKATDVYIHWEPKNDKFSVSETTTPFVMYEGDTKMSGTLILTTTGLEGDGLMDFGTAEMESKIFKYKADDFKADTTSFALKDATIGANSDSSNVAFKTDNVKGDISMEGRKGKFKSNSDQSFVDFPMNSFKAYMEELEWYMDNNEVDMNSKKVDDIGLKGALFVSTDPRLDSLSFVAPQAKFVLTDKLIACENVEYIDVADSRIFPSDKKVNIRRNAKIDPFTNAKIWVAKEEKRHQLAKANVTIFTSHKYSGNAEYSYMDEVGTAQKIYFSQVDVNDNDITYANGVIEPINSFTLSPYFGFKGKVGLLGSEQFLNFDGFAKVVHNCSYMVNDWLKFQTRIDPNNILIPVTLNPENDQNNKLFNGFLFASDSTGIYPAIFTPKKRYSDIEVLQVDGFLYFDKKSTEFRLAKKEKIFDRDLPGNMLSFNTSNCTSFGEGRMDMGSKMGQVELKCAGNIMIKPNDEQTTLDLVMTVDFKLDNGIIKFMQDKMQNVGGAGVNVDEDQNRKGISDLLDSLRAEKLFAERTNDGKFRRLPRELAKTMVLTDLHFTWDKSQRSLLHNGPIGMLVLGGEQVGVTANAYVELNRKTSGDILTMYIEFDDSHWYFFYYRNNVMQVFSGDKQFNDLVTAIDGNKRQFSEPGKPTYSYTISSQRRVDKFKEQFEQPGGGSDSPVQPESPSDDK